MGGGNTVLTLYLLCESTHTNSSALVMLVFTVSREEWRINLRIAGSDDSEPALTLEYVLVEV